MNEELLQRPGAKQHPRSQATDQHLAALQNLGYTPLEARFLYLVPTHSGYFIRGADLDVLRAGDHRYQGEAFEYAYKKWTAKGLTDAEIDGLLDPSNAKPERNFQTFALPEDYDIFCSETRPTR